MNGSVSKPQPLVWLRIGGALLFALLYLYPIMGVVLCLQALGCFLYAVIFDDDEEFGRAFRVHMTRQANGHGPVILWALQTILGFKVNFTFDRTNIGVAGQPVIIVPNHLSIMDIPLAVVAMYKIGRGAIRWVLKAPLKWVIPIGWAAQWIWCAFVLRGGTKTREADLASVKSCGECAYNDGQDVLIFSEGTRRGPSDGHGPKRGGFEALLNAMPLADVVTIVFRWSDEGGRPVGRGVVGAALSLPGRTIDVEIKRVPRAEIHANWLNEHFAAVRAAASSSRLSR